MAKKASTSRTHFRSNLARIEYIKVQNYRALQSLELRDLTPLTVLLGPNGSGKSTLFDVFSFLAESFQTSLRSAWDRRGRGRELKTRGQTEPISFELKYRESPKTPIITYHLAIDEGERGPMVVKEWLQWRRGSRGQPFRFLDVTRGEGRATSGDEPDEQDRRIDIRLRSPDVLAVNTLGQFAEHPRVAALREFITDWYISYLSVNEARNQPEAGPQDRLSRTGDNLANVVQYLKEQHPERLEMIFTTLRERIPQLESVFAEAMPDGRLLLQIKDAPFDVPIQSRFASDGTLKMLAYLTLLYDPNPPQFIGIEEPENFLHPRLLHELAEECRTASQRTQLLITTHSPFLLNVMRPKEVWMLYRDQYGYTQAQRASDNRELTSMIEQGAVLGDLWMEGYFGVGDPLTNAGRPRLRGKH